MNFLDKLVGNPLGAIGVLAFAAFLEAFGDSLFQTGFYRSSGLGRVAGAGGGSSGAGFVWFGGEFATVGFWEVAGFMWCCFLWWRQILNGVVWTDADVPIYVGGSIVAGGMVIAFGG